MWSVQNLRPFAIVEDGGLARFIDSILDHFNVKDRYKPPSADAITTRLQALKADVVKKVR